MINDVTVNSLAAGDEYLVNTTLVQGDQYSPKVAVLTDGGYVAIWHSGQSFYGKLYSGTGASTEFQINAQTSLDAEVVGLADGGYVVAWQSQGGTISAQTYDAQGAVTGVSQLSPGTPTNSAVALSALSTGGFVATWTSGSSIETAEYTSSCVKVGGSSDAAGSGTISAPDVAVVGPSDTMVSTWSNSGGCQIRIGSSSSTASTNGGPVGTTAVAAQGDGRILTVWSQQVTGDNHYAIYGRFYNADGSASSDPFLVNGYTSSNQLEPDVIALEDGGWLIAWSSNGGDASQFAVHARRYDNNGNALSGEFLVNQEESQSQQNPSLAAAHDGGFIAAWQSSGQDGYGLGVYARRYSLTTAPVVEAVGAVIGSSHGVPATALVAADDAGALNGLSSYDSLVFEDLTAGGGHFEYDGAEVQAGAEIIVPVGDLSKLEFIGGSTSGYDQFSVAGKIGAITGATQTAIVRTVGSDVTPALGGEQQVNASSPSGDQTAPQVTVLANGATAVVWQSVGNQIYGRYYGATGSDSGQFYVGAGGSPQVEQLSTGGFVVGWRSAEGIVSARLYDASGTALGGAIQLLTGAYAGTTVSLGALDNGGFAVTTQTGSGATGVQTVFFDEYGARTDTPAVTASSATATYRPTVAILPNGNIAQLWGDATSAVLQINAPDGSIVAGATNVSPYSGSADYTAIACRDDGTIFVTWSQLNGSDSSGYGVYGRFYDANGNAISSAFQVNAYSSSGQLDPDVTALSDGGWLVSWTSYGQDGNNNGVFSRRYDASGTAVSGDVQLSETFLSAQEASAVSGRTDGGYVAVWQSFGQDGDGFGIEMNVAASNHPPTAGAVALATDEDKVLEFTAETLTNAASDLDGDVITLKSVGQPSSGGSLTSTASGWAFTPNKDFNGTVTFGYTITDGIATTEGTATIVVRPVNDLPVLGAPVSLTTLEDVAITISSDQLAAGATDVDGDALTAANLFVDGLEITPNADGKTWTFTPATNFNGTLALSYTIDDHHGGQIPASGSLTVTPVNDPPEPGSPNFTVEEDHSLTISAADLLAGATDVDDPVGNLSVYGDVVANNGTLIKSDDEHWVFLPDENFNGVVELTYQITDSHDAVAASAAITVTPVNDPPVVSGPVTASHNVWQSYIVTPAWLLQNASDVDVGDVLSVAPGITVQSGPGQLVSNGNGTWTLTTSGPGPVTLSYKVTDGTAAVDATAIVTVSGEQPLSTLKANDEAVVNTVTAGDQTNAQVAMMADGSYVVIWLYGSGIFGQRYSSAGVNVGSQFTISASGAGAKVEALDNGSFVVAYRSGSGQVSAKLYQVDAQGQLSSSSATLTSSAYSATTVSLSPLSTGGFVATWQTGTSSVTGVETATFTSAGARTGGYAVSGAATYSPSVAALPDLDHDGHSDRVQVWGTDTGVKLQVTTDSGAPVGSLQSVSPYSGACTTLSVATSQYDGSIFVVWSQANGSDTNSNGVYGRFYNADGSYKSDAFLINGYTSSTQTEPDVVALADGGWVVSWSSYNQDGAYYGVFARRFDEAGNALTGDFQVNQFSSYYQQSSSLAASPAGGFVAAWQSGSQDGSGWGIVSRLYPLNTTPVVKALNAQVGSGKEMSATGLVAESHSQGNAGVGAGLQDFTQFEFIDETSGGGYFKLDGVTMASGESVIVSAARLSDLVFVGADGVTSDTFKVRGFDGTDWSAWQEATIKTVPSTGSLVATHEYAVNTTTANDQYAPQVAVLTNGSYVVVWLTGTEVDGQLYAADGTKMGQQFVISAAANTAQAEPEVTAVEDGGFVVAWRSGSQVSARRYDASGTAQGGQIQLTSSAVSSSSVALTPLSNGGFAAAWQTGSTSATGVQVARFDSYGALTDSDAIASSGVNYTPSVARLTETDANGKLTDYLVQSWGTDTGVTLRKTDQSGDTVWSTSVSPYTGPCNTSAVAVQSDGTIFVVWAQTNGSDINSYGVYGCRYSSSGQMEGSPFQINGYYSSTQTEPDVIALADGGWLVSWSSYGEDDAYYGVYARRYDSQGNALTGDTRLNEYTLYNQQASSLAASADGGFVAAWQTGSQDGSGWGIESRLYSPSTAAPVVEALNAMVGSGKTVAAAGLVAEGHTQGDTGVSAALQSFTEYEFVASGSGGHFELDGETVANGTSITLSADELSRLTFRGAGGSATDSFQVRGFDGYQWSTWQSAAITTVPSTGTLIAGSEIQANTTTSGDQYNPEVAVLANGSYVVTWLSGNSVDGQMFSASGAKMGGQFNVTSGGASTEEVVALTNGGFAAVWSLGGVISARFYDASGSALGGPVQLASGAFTSTTVSIAADNDGFAVTWQTGSTGTGIETMLVDQYGARQVDSGRITAASASATHQPTVTVLPNGNVAQLWGNGTTVQMQVSDPNGNSIGGTTTVSPYTGSADYTAIASQDDGTIFATWAQLNGSDASGYGIYGRFYDASGNPLTSAFQINAYTSSTQIHPEVIALENGGWMVSWSSYGEDGAYYGTYSRRYDASGAAVTGDVRVNVTTSYDQSFGSLAARSDGGFVAVWQSQSQDGSGFAIESRLYVDPLEGDSEDNALYGTEKDDQLIGNGGNDTLLGGSGNDLYIFNSGDGADLIDNTGEGGAMDVLQFGGDIAAEDLWLSQNGSDLEVRVLGTADRVTVKDWYANGGANTIATLALSDGRMLSAAEVGKLVTAMASLCPDSSSFMQMTAGQQEAFDQIVSSSWH